MALVTVALSACADTPAGIPDAISLDLPMVVIPDGPPGGDVPPGVDLPPPPDLPMSASGLPVSRALTPYVEPDDGRGFITDAIGQATNNIKLVMYLFTDQPLIDALAAAAGRGVNVRLLYDNSSQTSSSNSSTISYLRSRGVAVQTGSSAFTYTHEKAMIVDDTTLYVMTLNFTESAFTSNREFAVRDDEPADVMAASGAFEADWARMPSGLSAAEPVISPDNSRDRMQRLLGGARQTLDLEIEELGDNTLLQVLLDRQRAGVRIRLLLDSQSATDGARLSAVGVDVRTLASLSVHAKMVIADGATLYLGSENLTSNSLDHNREFGVFTDTTQVITRFQATFESDWAQGQPAQ
jgi:phosphatidylserine/phosphatidylglycerophosphate/cardiolipin synthase-like enzyme